MMVQDATVGIQNGPALSVVLCTHDPRKDHFQPSLPKASFARLFANAVRLRPSEALFEGQRWMMERSRSAVDRSFDQAKRRGIERFFTTIHG
ncbi:MAG: hypothetical protein IT225_05130 [Flavobacteriales bacterium]|jgi:hypothetical protein|nr:hypothetical protein [Flavobacteriales bacterium]